MSKDRILLVVPSLRAGGAEKVMVHLANHLDRERFEPFLAVGTAEGPNAENLKPDVTLYNLGAMRSRAAVPAILKAVRTVKPRAVISTLGFNFAVAITSPLFPRGTRTLLREGSTASAYIEAMALQNKTDARISHYSHRLLYGLADKIICQSDFMKDDLAKVYHLPEHKLARIYNPVDFDRIDELAAAGDNPFKGEGPHLLTIGTLYHAKGYDFLLPAFAKVRQRFPGATLTFLGDGEDREQLIAQANQIGLGDSARFAGFEANPYRWLKYADLFVSSSRYEGLANVILEAMALGTPVVATDCPGGNREVMEEGVTGWLARPQDPDSIAETILIALSAAPPLDAQLIRARCQERFSVRRIIAEYEALF